MVNLSELLLALKLLADFMKIALLLLFIFATLASNALSQSLNLRFNHFFYSWERADSIGGESTPHLRGYQNLSADLNKGNWGINTWMQTGEDFANRIGRGFDYSLYNAYIRGTNLFDALDLKLGRQLVFAGVGRGSLDGLLLKLKAGKSKEFQLTAYGGFNTPGDYGFTKYGSLSNDFLAGARFGYYGAQGITASLSFAERRKNQSGYTTERLDSTFNTAEFRFENDSKQLTLGGLDFSYNYKMNLETYGKLYYDFNRKLIYKGDLNASYSTGAARISASYLYREPLINYNSIFWTFVHSGYQEIEGSFSYTLNNGYLLFAKAADVLYEDDNSLRYQLGFSAVNFGLSFVGYSGYTGNSIGFNANGSFQLIREILSASASVNYSNYRIGSIEKEKSNALGILAGLDYRPDRRFTVTVQGQLATNKNYQNDSRILLGFNYWLFANLNQ